MVWVKLRRRKGDVDRGRDGCSSSGYGRGLRGDDYGLGYAADLQLNFRDNQAAGHYQALKMKSRKFIAIT
jgi:hypothetical protein